MLTAVSTSKVMVTFFLRFCKKIFFHPGPPYQAGYDRIYLEIISKSIYKRNDVFMKIQLISGKT